MAMVLRLGVEAWFSWMTSMAWQVAVLFAVLALAGFLLRHRSARFRYCLWTLVPIRLVLPPTLACVTGWAWWILPSEPVNVAKAKMTLDVRGETGLVVSTEPLNSRHGGDRLVNEPVHYSRVNPEQALAANESRRLTADFPDREPAVGLQSERSAPLDSIGSFPPGIWKTLLFGAWWIGVSLLSVRLLVGYGRVRRWIVESTHGDETLELLLEECCRQLGYRRSVSVRISTSVWTPLVTVLPRPVILLPPAAIQLLNPQELRAILMHELQHIVRKDIWHEWVLTFVQIVYFFHPCVWLAARTLRRLREQACDEATVAVLNGERTHYGSGFVKIAELLMKPAPVLTLGIVDSDELPSSRLRRILDPGLRVGRTVSWTKLLLIAVLGLILIPSAARRVAEAVPGQVAATQAASSESKRESAKSTDSKTKLAETNVPDDSTDDIKTIGDHNVEPIEIHGQVLDVAGMPSKQSAIFWEGYSRTAARWKSSITTDNEGAFRVRLKVKKEMLVQLSVLAVSSDNSQIGSYRFPRDQASPTEPISIQLGEARTVRLKVIDKAGTPIQDAHAAWELAFPMKSLRATTSKDGIAEIAIPANERIQAVVAWKDNAGLDYHVYRLPRDQMVDAITKAPEFPAGGTETLTLEGATAVTVKVVDDDGQPVSDVRVYPWLLKKDTQNDDLNLSMHHETFAQRTDSAGISVFAWLPSWQTGITQFWPNKTGYNRQRGLYTPANDKGHMEIVLKKHVPIRGRVQNADGTPAANISISAIGAGYTLDEARENGWTDSNGEYEIMVPPDQIYLVVASGKGFAAAPQTGFAVFKGQPVAEKNFTLRPATRIYGTLIDEDTKEPVPNARVFVYQYGKDLHSMNGVELPNPEQSRTYVQPLTTQNTQTNDQGQFELFVGDGNFDIRPPQQEKAEKFEIAGETEREFLLTTKLSKEVELTGVVRIADTDTPLEGATLFGVSRSHGGRDWRATTSKAGEFRVKQHPAATYVYAHSSDKSLGAIMELEAKQPSVELALQPVGTAKGRLLELESKEAWAGQIIQFGIRVPDENEQTWSNRFGGRITTADDGTFELVGLVPGWEYELTMESRTDGTIPFLGKTTVKPGEAVSIGDVSPPPPRKPYVPPTLEQQIAESFAVAGTPLERNAKAIERIKLVNQHMLIVFGVPEDPQIHQLMEIRFNDSDFRPLSDEFRFMAIPTDAARLDAAKDLAATLNESLDGDRARFLLVLLDSTGTKVAFSTAAELSDGDEISRERFFEWLRKFQPAPLNARKVFDDALAQAKEQNKRVLIQETATWCGPCVRLSAFLNNHRAWEKDYIWIKMDHRYTGAQELMAELREGANGGIPWFAILDADGKKLATSNELKSHNNIGFPTEPGDLVHFEHMLKSTRQRLTDEEISELISSLKTSE